MIIATLGTLLRDTEGELLLSSSEGHCLFAVRDGPIVFWVGHGSNIRRRIFEHLARWPSRLGKLILNNVPASFEWTIEMWSLSDCVPYVPTETNIDEETGRLALVRHYQPCLNVTGNPHPTPLPTRYHASLDNSTIAADLATVLTLLRHEPPSNQ